MIFDTGHQFDTTKVTDYLIALGCHAQFIAVAHPRTNGQAEAAHNVILHGLQKKPDEAQCNCTGCCMESYSPSL